MKKAFIILVVSILILKANPFGAIQSDEKMAQPLSSDLPEDYTSLLPEGYAVPARLPATIEDPLLLTAWVYLYNQQEPVVIHDGIIVTGRGLAELVFEHSIPVLWGSDTVCDGSSCAKRTLCADKECVANDQNKDGNPIYIALKLQDAGHPLDAGKKAFPWLVKTLAHELYHQMQPFGPVPTSLYEEYWAFYIGTQVSKAGWMEFNGYNPLKSACLKRWFLVYGLETYSGVDLYPFTLQAEVDRVSETCTW